MKSPKWNVPKNLKKLVEEEGGIWEDDRWEPILLSVMTDTNYGGRDIPLAWQIEFQPDDERFKAANQALEALGLDSDGYGWAERIEAVFNKEYPKLASQLNFGDTESDACVVWVETESTCKTLVEVVWALIHVRKGRAK
jgi:hypothetical protein